MWSGPTISPPPRSLARTRVRLGNMHGLPSCERQTRIRSRYSAMSDRTRISAQAP